MRSFVVTCTLALMLAAAASAEYASPRAVYERLLAPCCWNQTLDIHDSPIATELRVEIEQRLARGEEARKVEDDLAKRFGERIRAVPRDFDPRDSMAWTLLSGMMLALCGLLALAWRWSRSQPVPAAPTPAFDAEYDEELERELRRHR